MDYGNYWLNEALQRLRREEIQRELAHERFMRAHGLDLWSVLGRAIGRLVLRREARSVQIARAPRPLRPAHRPPAGRPDLVEAQPAGPGGDMRDTAA